MRFTFSEPWRSVMTEESYDLFRSRFRRPTLFVTLTALFLLTGLAPVHILAADCVILLHGLARTAASMTDLEEAFIERSYVVANVDYPSREYPIETLSEMAIEAGLDQCAQSDHQSVHFVTHSLGGILVRYYLTEHELPRLGRVVMLAPPNQGSEVIDEFGWLPGFHLLNGPAGDQLGTRENSVPRQLGEVTYPVGILAGTHSINWILSTALPNPDDGKVFVESTRVEGMTDFMTLPISHPFIMSDPDAIRQTLRFIETGQFERSGK